MSRLVFELSKLPGIGEKTAHRLAHYILRQDSVYSQALAHSIVEAKSKTQLCESCYTFTDEAVCPICADSNRDISTLCIVESPSDIQTLENTGVFRGRYHVLHGVISPLDGIGPEELKIDQLLQRLSASSAPSLSEIILAINPSVEGDATCIYLSRVLANHFKGSGGTSVSSQKEKLKITRLAHGLPAGGQIEFSDRQTLSKAIENRQEVV